MGFFGHSVLPRAVKFWLVGQWLFICTWTIAGVTFLTIAGAKKTLNPLFSGVGGIHVFIFE